MPRAIIRDYLLKGKDLVLSYRAGLTAPVTSGKNQKALKRQSRLML